MDGGTLTLGWTAQDIIYKKKLFLDVQTIIT